MKSVLTQIGQYFLMLNKTFSFPEKKSIFLKQFNLELEKIGLNSLGIVTIISFFIGAIVIVLNFLLKTQKIKYLFFFRFNLNKYICRCKIFQKNTLFIRKFFQINSFQINCVMLIF